MTWSTTLNGPKSDEAFGVSGINLTIATPQVRNLTTNDVWTDDLSGTKWNPSNVYSGGHHGFWGNGGTLTRTFRIDTNVNNYVHSYSTVTLNFNALVLCTWDAESFQLKVNNVEKWSQTYTATSPYTTIPTEWTQSGSFGCPYYSTYPISVTFNQPYNQDFQGFCFCFCFFFLLFFACEIDETSTV